MSLHHKHYKDIVPSEIRDKLIELYQSPFSVKEYFYLYKNIINVNVLAIYNDDAIAHILFYEIKKNEVVVINEVFAIDDEYVSYFSSFIFYNHKHINTIHFNKIFVELCGCEFPHIIWNTSNDIILHLPESFDAYQSRLGKKIKKNLKYYTNKLHREYEDFSFSIQATDRIEPAVVSRIVEMNRLRMDSKHITSGFDRSLENKIKEFCKIYGLTSTISVDGKVIAGTICYEVGKQAYLEIVSHDPDYNESRVGQICLYLTIKYLIERGHHAFHMLWGEYEYKYNFMGVRNNTYTVSIFRSKVYKMIAHVKFINKYHYVIKARNIIKFQLLEKIKYLLFRK